MQPARPWAGPAGAAGRLCFPAGCRGRDRALERLWRASGTGSTLTLAELADDYLAQHDAEPETIEKLRWLLAKAVRVFGKLPHNARAREHISVAGALPRARDPALRLPSWPVIVADRDVALVVEPVAGAVSGRGFCMSSTPTRGGAPGAH